MGAKKNYAVSAALTSYKEFDLWQTIRGTRARACTPVAGSSPPPCNVKHYAPCLGKVRICQARLKQSSIGTFVGTTSTSSMIKLPFGVGNCMWRMPSEFRLSTSKTKPVC
jgi:hypothetical protein